MPRLEKLMLAALTCKHLGHVKMRRWDITNLVRSLTQSIHTAAVLLPYDLHAYHRNQRARRHYSRKDSRHGQIDLAHSEQNTGHAASYSHDFVGIQVMAKVASAHRLILPTQALLLSSAP